MGQIAQKVSSREAYVNGDICQQGNVPCKHTILDLLKFPSFKAVDAALMQHCADSYILY